MLTIPTMQMNNIDPGLFEMLDFKPKKGDIKKMEIIGAAIECLATIGFENTTYEAIAKKLGTRRAHIAYHFSDKNDIFKASIRFINATYLLHSKNLIEESQSGEEMLKNFIRAPFLWGEENPNQLAVMLLFYYLCSVNEEYRELHTQIRTSGVQRIHYILTTKINIKLDNHQSLNLAKHIQNLLSGAIIDAVSTSGKNLIHSMKETEEYIMNHIKDVMEK